MNYETTQKIVEEQFTKEILPNLSEFIKIDNLSPAYDKEWNTNGKLEHAAKFCLDWALKQGIKGIKGELIKDEDKTPVIFIEIEALNSDKNILMYGHFDKQPHFTGWAEGLGPTTPVIKDGFLYGRGGADDGYAIFSCITALKAIQEQGGKHGRIVLLIEGSEESGSIHLVPYITKLKDRIGTPDLLVCLDSGCQDYDTLWITNSLRGVVILDVTVETLEEGVHSGAGSGLAPDSFTVLRNILDRIDDSKTQKVIEEFHVEVPKNRLDEINRVAELKKEKVLEHVKLTPGVEPLTHDYTELIIRNTWAPTLVVVGASGLPAHDTAGNVLRPNTSFRLSMRLPPTYDPNVAMERLNEIVTKDPPFNAKITTSRKNPGPGWNNKQFSQKLHDSLNTSSQKLWGKEYFSFGEGGSIPFIKLLADSFPECEIIVCGVLGPNSNAHSCNEALNIGYCKNITSTITHTLHDYSS